MASKSVATKKKAKKRGRIPSRSPQQIITSTPLSKEHELHINQVKRALKASELANKKLDAAEQKLVLAKARVSAHVEKSTARKQSATVKKALDKTRTAALIAKQQLFDCRSAARDADKLLKLAMHAAELEMKKEIAMQQAVETFKVKWLKEWNRKLAKNKKSGKKRRKKQSVNEDLKIS